MIRALAILLTILTVSGLPAAAAITEPVRGTAVEGRLLMVEDGTGEAGGGTTLSAGLELVLDAGWKTYWRSPGSVGLPPAIDWSGSTNVAGMALAYPAPERFDAFEIENYGYKDAVTYPLTVTLEEPGAPARISLVADVLVCAELCVPERLDFALDLAPGGGVDAAAAARLAPWVARVPGGVETGLAVEAAHLDAAALTVRARSAAPFRAPGLFPEQDGAAFGPPVFETSPDGRDLWARLPVLTRGEGALTLTLVSGDRAATLPAPLSAAPPPRPGTSSGLWPALLAAFLGGLILNVMPCVLPVLSIKLASALQARDRGPAQVRAGFLASAAGVLGFFLVLAAIAIGLRAAGVAVGWGMQFQQPVFLALMAGLMVLFAANMAGLFELSPGSRALTAMARAEGRRGLAGDVATGAFAAIMATPCSAPFLGTAVTYALTHGAGQTVVVFAAMGGGLAVPFLLVAARPGLVRRLPRPGRWMRAIRTGLAALLAVSAIWLLTVLAGVAGPAAALAAGAAAGAMAAALAAWRGRALPLAGAGLAAMALAVALIPGGRATATNAAEGPWQPFEQARIAREVADGNTVFVDVTAAWCLTCQANKRLVLDGAPVREALAGAVALRADWTRPDPEIAAFLAAHDRYGIPFDAVFGPGAPEGIVLPELLTESAVLKALRQASGG